MPSLLPFHCESLPQHLSSSSLKILQHRSFTLELNPEGVSRYSHSYSIVSLEPEVVLVLDETHPRSPLPFYLTTLDLSLYPHAPPHSSGSISAKIELEIIQTRLWTVWSSSYKIIEGHPVGLDHFSEAESSTQPIHSSLLHIPISHGALFQTPLSRKYNHHPL